MSDVASQPQAVNNTDSRGSTNTNVGRDVHNHYYLSTIRFGRSIIVVYKCDADADHDDTQQWKHDDSVGLHELKLVVFTDHTHSFLVIFLD